MLMKKYIYSVKKKKNFIWLCICSMPMGKLGESLFESCLLSCVMQNEHRLKCTFCFTPHLWTVVQGKSRHHCKRNSTLLLFYSMYNNKTPAPQHDVSLNRSFFPPFPLPFSFVLPLLELSLTAEWAHSAAFS